MNEQPEGRLWIVTTADTAMIGQACVVQADTPEEAAAEGFAWFDESDDGPPHTATVLPFEEGNLYRAIYAAERVPDEFQCCGGMPNMRGLGTENRHTVPCSREPSEEHPPAEGGRSCPDGGRCWHHCGKDGPCWRVFNAAPLAMAGYVSGSWPETIRQQELTRATTQPADEESSDASPPA